MNTTDDTKFTVSLDELRDIVDRDISEDLRERARAYLGSLERSDIGYDWNASLWHEQLGNWIVRWRGADGDGRSTLDNFFNETQARLVSAAPALADVLDELLSFDEREQYLPLALVVRAREALKKAGRDR